MFGKRLTKVRDNSFVDISRTQYAQFEMRKMSNSDMKRNVVWTG